MREIKFKIWNNASGQWADKNSFELFQSEKENTYSFRNYLVNNEPDGEVKYILCQFTGLKDKNEVEIFDGDRVKQRMTDFENGGFIDMFYEVRWAKWCYGLYIADKWIATLDTPKANSIEVVGNIFEK